MVHSVAWKSQHALSQITCDSSNFVRITEDTWSLSWIYRLAKWTCPSWTLLQRINSTTVHWHQGDFLLFLHSMPRFCKKTPELKTEVNVIYRTFLPSPFSEEELRRILEKFSPNLTSDVLTLQVTKRAIFIGRPSEKKSIVSFKRKDLMNVNLAHESDCLLLTRKLKRGRQELLLIRFADSDALMHFRRIFNCLKTNDLRGKESSLVQQQRVQERAFTPCEERDELQTLAPALRSEPSGSPIHLNRRTISHECTRECPRRHLPESRSLQRVPVSRILKDHRANPDVYIIKHIIYGRNGSKENEYSRVTIYDIDSDYSDSSSEFSAYSSSTSKN